MQAPRYSLITSLLLTGIRLAREAFPRGGWPACRFVPTCSSYAAEAITRHGALKGLGLALWRLLRCQPLSRGGVDPVR